MIFQRLLGEGLGLCTAAKAISATRRMIDTRRETTGMVKSCQAKRAIDDLKISRYDMI